MFPKVDLIGVQEIMSGNFRTFLPSNTFREVLEVFWKLRVDLAPVVDTNGRLIGIINKYCLYRALLNNVSLDDSIEMIYIRAPRYVHCSKSATELWQYLDRYQVGQVIVVNDKGSPRRYRHKKRCG